MRGLNMGTCSVNLPRESVCNPVMCKEHQLDGLTKYVVQYFFRQPDGTGPGMP